MAVEPRGCPTPGACSAIEEIARLREEIHTAVNVIEEIRRNLHDNALSYTTMRLGQLADSLTAARGGGPKQTCPHDDGSLNWAGCTICGTGQYRQLPPRANSNRGGG